MALAISLPAQSEPRPRMPELLGDLADKLKSVGWTVDIADVQQNGDAVTADYISIFSPDYNISLFVSEPSIANWRDAGETFQLAKFTADNVSLEITEMPLHYGSQDLTTLNFAIRNPALTNVILKKVLIPRFFTVAGRVPPGGAEENPSNQLRAFFDGLMIYVLQGGVGFSDLSAQIFIFSEGKGQNERLEKFEQVQATDQAAGRLKSFKAESWISSNDILPRSIKRGRINLTDLNFQH